MKTLLFSLMTLLVLYSGNIEEVRSYFHEASKNKENAASFNETVLRSTALNKDLFSAYLGASEALLAKFSPSPGEKLQLFKSGKANLEKAVENQPQNIEIRLIRLIIQSNAPEVLKYNTEIKKDKEFILTHFKSAPEDVRTFIRKTAESTTLFTLEELTKIK